MEMIYNYKKVSRETFLWNYICTGVIMKKQ